MPHSLKEQAAGKQILDEVQRILKSETFQNSEMLRQLLKFLAEKTALGQEDQLKEYTIAVDAMHKPVTYDPRRNSAVRIQVGRLRQKLAEYFQTEGKDDSVIIELPRGHFRLRCNLRQDSSDFGVSRPTRKLMRTFMWAGASAVTVVAIALGWGAFSLFRIQRTEGMVSASQRRLPLRSPVRHRGKVLP